MTRSIRRWGSAALGMILVGAMVTACTSGGAGDEPNSDESSVPAAALEIMNQPQYSNGRW
ncbi:MAG: hypothetical protein GX875_06980, partial [Propionibacterium sp.]|nr:hypothetical protein [Propionibacterium sp.]